jgi:hypothetical protein
MDELLKQREQLCLGAYQLKSAGALLKLNSPDFIVSYINEVTKAKSLK